MTRVTEVYEQVKALTAEERSQLAELMNEVLEVKAPASERKFVKPDYAAQLKADFPQGIVIEDPDAFWEEMRAERIELLR